MTNITLVSCLVTVLLTIAFYQSAKKTKKEIWDLAEKEGKTDKIFFQAMNNPNAPYSDIWSFVFSMAFSVLVVFLCVHIFMPKKDLMEDKDMQQIKQELQSQLPGHNRQETSSQTSGQQPKTDMSKQNQKVSAITKETGLKFSNITYEELPNYDGQGHLRVVIRCMVENVSNRKVYISYSDIYLRKENENTFEAKWDGSGVTKELNEMKTGAKNLANFSGHMDLFPKDKAAIICTYDTSIKGSSASGSALYKSCMSSNFSENLVFICNIP